MDCGVHFCVFGLFVFRVSTYITYNIFTGNVWCFEERDHSMTHAVLVCPLASCQIENLIIDKFIIVRLHFTLKDSSVSFSQKSVKRKKKMMKLCHQ
jgi:hypothetical protein